MPTTSGAETIGEALARKRAELVRARAVIARAETNGAAFNIGGTAITEVAYEAAQRRCRDLEADIATLEARLSGSSARPCVAQFQTRVES